MGGRGATHREYLGRTEKDRMNEFRSLLTDKFNGQTIKFLVQNDTSISSTQPKFSNTKNRIYVIIKDGKIQSIVKYGNNHKDVFSINPKHSGEIDKFPIHEHSSIESGRKKTTMNNMSKEHIKLYNHICKIFKNNNLADKSKVNNNGKK